MGEHVEVKTARKPAARKEGAEATGSSCVLLDTTERLMLEEGYAAVTTRRVAKVAGFTSALVHYYYPTTDDLLIALYRRTTERQLARLNEVLASDQPLRAMWALYTQAQPTALGLEFMAMANHRKAIRSEIARFAEYSRGLQAGALARLVKSSGFDPAICPPACLSVLLAGVWRVLVMEEGLGITAGHAETRAFMEWLIERLEPNEVAAHA